MSRDSKGILSIAIVFIAIVVGTAAHNDLITGLGVGQFAGLLFYGRSR